MRGIGDDGLRVTPTSNSGTSCQAGVPFKVVFSWCGRSTAATRNRSWIRSIREQTANGFARHAYRSRTQFYRVFRALIEETPIAMRRRLLLERAAWQLSRTKLSVTDIGLRREVRIARSLHPGVPQCLRRLTEPLSPHGRDVHSPPHGEWNSPPFR